jgi:hypothetical protein
MRERLRASAGGAVVDKTVGIYDLRYTIYAVNWREWNQKEYRMTYDT